MPQPCAQPGGGWMALCTCSCLSFFCCGAASRQVCESMAGRGSQAERANFPAAQLLPLSPLQISFFMFTPPPTLQVSSALQLLPCPVPGILVQLLQGKGLSAPGTATSPSTWECLARETPRGGSKIRPFPGFLPEAPRINLAPAPRTSERPGGHPN